MTRGGFLGRLLAAPLAALGLKRTAAVEDGPGLVEWQDVSWTEAPNVTITSGRAWHLYDDGWRTYELTATDTDAEMIWVDAATGRVTKL